MCACYYFVIDVIADDVLVKSQLRHIGYTVLRHSGAMSTDIMPSVYCYCSSDLPGFEELLDESDDRLFCNTLYNSAHTLHTLLPPQSTASQYYHLRLRTHDRQLPTPV